MFSNWFNPGPKILYATQPKTGAKTKNIAMRPSIPAKSPTTAVVSDINDDDDDDVEANACSANACVFAVPTTLANAAARATFDSLLP